MGLCFVVNEESRGLNAEVMDGWLQLSFDVAVCSAVSKQCDEVSVVLRSDLT